MDFVKRQGVAKLFLHLLNMNSGWENLPECGCLKHFKKGKVLTGQADKFYLLQSGIIRAVVTTPQGQDWTLLFQERGCIFNEMNMFLDCPDKIYYLCQTDVSVYVFDGTLLKDPEFYRSHPGTAINLLTTLAVKEAIGYAYTTDIARADAMGRVCLALVALVRENDNKTEFSPETTQAEIASMMGLHQTTVARVVKELRAQNVIGKFTKKRLEVLDRDRLFSLAYGGRLAEDRVAWPDERT